MMCWEKRLSHGHLGNVMLIANNIFKQTQVNRRDVAGSHCPLLNDENIYRAGAECTLVGSISSSVLNDHFLAQRK